MAKRVRRSNVKDGVLLPLGNGFSLVKGDHPNKVDDVDIGPNNKNGLSVNHGEILQQKGNTLRVFSAEPMLGGISPTQLLYGGMAPDKVFAMQEQYKRANRIADDGTKYQDGGKINRNKQTYDTILNDKQEIEFSNWYKDISSKLKLNSNPDDYNHAYDYRGYWLENKDNDINYSAKDFHFPDKYKKPNHETFSNESIYANKKYGIDPKTVGYWKNDVFIPGSFNNLMNNNYKNSLEKEGFYYKNDEQLSLRQRYAESTFNDKALNRWSKAAGAYQIMPHIHKAYVKATGNKGDLYDLEYNTAIRNWLMNDINKNAYIKDSRNSNRNRLIKTYAAYNWGSGNLGTLLRQLEKEGIDTFNSYDWVNRLPKETKDYVNFIIHGDNINDIKNNEKYKEALDSLRTKKEFGGRKKLQAGGENKGNGFKIVKQRTDFKPTKLKTFLRRLYVSDDSAGGPNRYGDFSRMYFGMPLKDNMLYESNYKPTKSTNNNTTYYGVNNVAFLNDLIQLYNYNRIKEVGKNIVVNGYSTKGEHRGITPYLSKDLARSLAAGEKSKLGKTPHTLGPGALGRFTIGRGKDDKGEYLSYYDLWDAPGNGAEENGFAKPYEIYDRIYGKFNNDGRFYPEGEIQPSIITANKKQFGGQTNINSLGERPNAKYGKEMKNKRKKSPLTEFVEAFKYLPSKSDLNSAFDSTKNLIEGDKFKGGDFGGAGASVGFYGKDGNNPYDYVRNTPILSNRTFSEAYANARKQGLSSFMFNGKKYNTDYDPNAKLGNRIVEQTPVLNLREILDENEKVITDSTRVEPWVGQLPGMYKRDKYKFGGKRNKALTGITISPYKDRFGNNIDLLKGTVDRDNSNINLLTGEVNHKIANPNNIKLLTGDISKNVVNPVGDLTKSSGLSTTAMSAIGAGINTLGSLIGAGIQQYAINNLKAPQRQYTLLSPVKLKTKININPQIAKMREMQAQIADAARRTSGSSRTAYQKILASHNRLLDSAMDLYGRKENIETELINRDRLNQQQVAQANATNVMNAINYNNEAATEMNNKKQIATSNNWTGALNTTAGAWAGPNGFIDRANALRVKAGELYTQAIANPTAAKLLYGNINFATDADKRKAFNTIYDFLNNNRFA